MFYLEKTKSTLPSNIRQNEITFIWTGKSRRKVQVLKQLGTINFWPKKTLLLYWLVTKHFLYQLFCYSILLLICAASPRNFIAEGRGIWEPESTITFNRCCFLFIIFIHFISNSWPDIQITWMYKVSEYYCSNHTIFSWMTNQSMNQMSVNTQNSLTCNKNTSVFLFKVLNQ